METSLHIAKRKQLYQAVLFLQKLKCRQDIENSDGITVNQIIIKEKQLRERQMGDNIQHYVDDQIRPVIAQSQA